jgi:lipoyl(octanoyl) transferase
VAENAKECLVVDLGFVDYARALDLQLRVCEAKKGGFESDVLLLLEHPPTITLGRNGKWRNLLESDANLAARGVGRYEVDRGGDITFHGPGQLVGYPLLKLDGGERDVHRLMWNFEESIIRLLDEYGISGSRIPKLTGVWTHGGKIAAMGVHISRWITRHGFALNANTDLSFYELIVPCGIAGRSVTSMEKELARRIDLPELGERYLAHFGATFRRRTIKVSEPDLLEAISGTGYSTT